MGALRIDMCENEAGNELVESVPAPRLVLTSFEELPVEVKKAPTARNSARVRRARRQRRDSYWMAAALVCLFFACAGGLWSSLEHMQAAAAPAETITATVKPGDTLWKYAKRFGSSDRYILDQVDDLARANSLSSRAALIPGQHLKIAVSNPVELAKLETSRETKLARR